MKVIIQNISFRQLIVFTMIGLFIFLTAINGMNIFKLLSFDTEKEIVRSNIPLPGQTKKIPTAQVIARWNLFGKEVVKSIRVPKSNLRLKLIGIISSTTNSQARVIVENSSRKQKYYKVGDEIKRNVKVKSIFPNHIVIVHNSRDEIVQLNALKNKKSILKKVDMQ